ncbi:Helix-loop-helix DNA-binding domain containing protein [Amanita muscaria]
MSFLTYKPHVRQEGFHLPSPPPSSATPPPNSSHNHGANTNNNLDIFNISASNHQFLPDGFRKFPSAANPDNTATAMDFENELASLISQPQVQSSNERSTQSPHPRSYDENGNYGRHMFDAVPLPSSASSTTSAFSSHNPHNAHSQHSQPSSLHSPTMMSEFTPPHTQFNAAMRYDSHHSHPHHSDGSGHPPPPSSYHFNNRHTPSPIHSQSQLSHNPDQSRSRSRSRPSSGGSSGTGNNPPGTLGGVGPTRTTRTRRNSNISSTSPPPGHHHHHPGRPQAIVIPRSTSNGHNGSAMSPISASGGQHENGAAWYIPNNPTSEFSLSESLHSHPSHSVHQGYTPFSLPSSTPNGSSSSTNHNSSDMHLPPVSALHSHSLPKSDMAPHFSPSGLPGSYPVQGMNGMSSLNGINGLNGGNIGNMNVNNINLAGGLAGPGGSPASPPLNSPIGSGHSNLNSGLNGITGLNGASKAATMTSEEKQVLIANEKRRRRRESHNAVERRRRDNINERISELATLIPECMLEAGSSQNPGSSSPLDDGVPPSPLEATSHVDSLSSKREDPDMHANGGDSASTGNGNGASANSGAMKANKGIILRRSVDYIRYLQQLVTAQGARNRELETELKAYRTAAGVLPSSASSTDGSSDEKKDTDSGLGSEPGRNDSSSPSMASDGEMPGIHGYQLVNGHKAHHGGHGHHPHAHPNGGHHGHGHGHMRNGSGGFGPFGGMFGLPSMPEGDSDEEGDEDMYQQVDMNDVMDGVLEGMDNMGEERLNRGRARLKIHTGGPGKIKKEQDLIAMEA